MAQVVDTWMPRLQAQAPYLEFDSTVLPFESFKKGVCLGMVQQCIMDYTKLRASNVGFREATQKVTTVFQKGASKQACILQLFQVISKLNEKVFEEQYPQDGRDHFSYFLNKVCTQRLTGFFVNGFTVHKRTTIRFITSDFTIDKLTNGAYLISSGLKLNFNNTNLDMEQVDGHAIALFVEDGQFLIFDPNVGLIQTANPDRYFEIHREGETGVVIADRIAPR